LIAWVVGRKFGTPMPESALCCNQIQNCILDENAKTPADAKKQTPTWHDFKSC